MARTVRRPGSQLPRPPQAAIERFTLIEDQYKHLPTPALAVAQATEAFRQLAATTGPVPSAWRDYRTRWPKISACPLTRPDVITPEKTMHTPRDPAILGKQSSGPRTAAN